MVKINKHNESTGITYLPQSLAVFLIFITILFLNIPIIETIWHYSFDDGTYSHAFLVPFIVGYLFYTLSANQYLSFRTAISWLALTILLLAAYLLFVTSTAQISLAYWLATLFVLCAAINFIFQPGFKVFFPVLYFVFLIPVWGLLTSPLQSLSVAAVNMLMSITSIPVFVEGQFVQIPSGIFEIAGGCSGLRYLLTSLAISSLFSFLYFRSIKNITIFVSIAIFGALLTNWLRIVGLIIIGHQTQMTSSLMDDHNMFGWYLYIPFMFLLFKLGGYLVNKEQNIKRTSPSTKTTNTQPNWTLLSILLVILLLASTSLRMSADTRIENKPLDLTTQPLIYHFSSAKIVANNQKTIQIIYNFNGSHLESKPSFFENNFIPEQWQVISINVDPSGQKIRVKNKLNTATITVSFEIANRLFGQTSKFKLERLKQGIIGNNNTKLHWQFALD